MESLESNSRPPREPLVQPGAIDCQVADMTATFSADVSKASARATLAAQNQWLPIDGPPGATIGALVEQNSTGPLRLGFGAWRDLLLGAQFFNGEGELISAGGRVVKNVAGYDLTKFMVGQRGIFGRLVTVTTRTHRLPTDAMLARFEPRTAIASWLLPTSCRPQWAVLVADALYAGYVGDRVTIDFIEQTLPSMRPSAVLRRYSLADDEAFREAIWSAPVPGTTYLRASVPPTKIAEMVDVLKAREWVADAVFGIVLIACNIARAPELIGVAESLHGSAMLLDPEGAIVQSTSRPVEAALLRRLKDAFDPGQSLNPMPGQFSSQ